jgi:hypothetical protein
VIVISRKSGNDGLLLVSKLAKVNTFWNQSIELDVFGHKLFILDIVGFKLELYPKVDVKIESGSFNVPTSPPILTFSKYIGCEYKLGLLVADGSPEIHFNSISSHIAPALKASAKY